MSKTYQIGGENVPYLGTYLGGTAIAPNGTAILYAVPAGATCANIRAEGAAQYYTINGGTASASSPGYVPSDMADFIWPIDNLGTIAVYSASGTAHIQCFNGM